MLKKAWDALWGRGEYSVTVPPMDGALRPNAALDEAETLLVAEGIDNLAVHGGLLYYTQGKTLLVLDAIGGTPRPVAAFNSDISALAISAAGKTAIGLDEGKLLFAPSPEEAGKGTEQSLSPPAHVTALAFSPNGDLYVCLGSAQHRPSQWKRDLMMRNASGSVLRIAAQGGAPELIGDRLAFPDGVGFFSDGTPVVVEAWKNRLLQRGGDGRWQPLLVDLPGYPGRIAPAADGGLWLAVFAPRSQMIEFVLREKLYRERMVERIDEQFWMAPTLRGGKSFKEPLQGGGVKHLGIHKPWGPTRSFGLVVKLDARGLPVLSQHSRSDGNRHGITSVLEWNGRTVAASKGDGVLISLIDFGGADKP
jgi:sugar lactone lactonase YvrE